MPKNTVTENVATRTPWEVHEHAPYSVWARDRQIAACRMLLNDGSWDPYFPVASAECEANARLIAAAPDLHDALKALLDRYVELVNCGDCGNWDPEIEPEVIAARAAIARAEGRS